MEAERHMGGDWMCTQNNKNLPVELIGMCSSTNGSTQGAESSRLSSGIWTGAVAQTGILTQTRLYITVLGVAGYIVHRIA